MAFVHGKNSYFSINSSDISEYVKDCSLAQSVDTPETSTFGNSAKTFITGLSSGTFSISGLFDPTCNTILAGLVGDSTAAGFVYGPAGDGSGAPQFTGGAIMTSYNVTSDVADAVGFTAEFQVTGEISVSTF